MLSYAQALALIVEAQRVGVSITNLESYRLDGEWEVFSPDYSLRVIDEDDEDDADPVTMPNDCADAMRGVIASVPSELRNSYIFQMWGR